MKGSRLSSGERRQQIFEAALDLLAGTSVESLSTRAVAKLVGISQPALFRHFRSRDDLLCSLVEHTRESLAGLTKEVLAQQADTRAALTCLLDGLFAYVEKHPGVPRLLFHNAAARQEPEFHKAISRLLSMQRSLISELIRQGCRREEFPEQLDAERATSFFLALVQGELLQWQLKGAGESPLHYKSSIMNFFWAGVSQGQPALEDRVGECEEESLSLEDRPSLVELDVCPILDTGKDPLETITSVLGSMAPDGLFLVSAPFRPSPLIQLMESRGYIVGVQKISTKEWVMEVVGELAPEIKDYRDLEAPEPMQKILEQVETLAPGEAMMARVPRVPHPLFVRLKERGLRWEVIENKDGTALVHIRRPA
jgi:TetR/AcrR family transcriptional regulator